MPRRCAQAGGRHVADRGELEVDGPQFAVAEGGRAGLDDDGPQLAVAEGGRAGLDDDE